MHLVKTEEHDLLAMLRPSSLIGALVYLVLFVFGALLISRALRATLHSGLTRRGHVDLTALSFLQQLGTVTTWTMMLILYAHLIPVLRSTGMALLAGASIASVVIGLAAQSTLGNLVAGIAIMIYRPFRLGDMLLVSTPTGTEAGEIQLISLGYTWLCTEDAREVVLPNSLVANQVTINLTRMHATRKLLITIRVSRESDLELSCQSARQVTTETLGKDAMTSCYLTRIESSSAVLELTVEVPSTQLRAEARARLVGNLAQHFAARGLGGEPGARASFC